MKVRLCNAYFIILMVMLMDYGIWNIMAENFEKDLSMIEFSNI